MTAAKSEVKKKKPAPKVAAVKTYRKLTPAQRAESAALWRAGTVTLVDLGKKYDRRPEVFSRLFTDMGIKRGEGAIEAAKKITEAVEARTLSDLDETMRKIALMRNEHYVMSHGLAKYAWNELARARVAKLDIAGLKDVMVTLKLAGEIIGNSRKELFTVLNVEKHEQDENNNDLPELTVRELTHAELKQLQNAASKELSLECDPGEEMTPVDFGDGL